MWMMAKEWSGGDRPGPVGADPSGSFSGREDQPIAL